MQFKHIYLWMIVLGSVGLSALAQVVLKSGMTSRAPQTDMSSTGWLGVAVNALTNPTVLAGLLMYALGAMLWLFVLTKLEVTKAYPFVGLGFIFTMILGHLVLGEAVGFERMIGTLLIVGGVVLVARS